MCRFILLSLPSLSGWEERKEKGKEEGEGRESKRREGREKGEGKKGDLRKEKVGRKAEKRGRARGGKGERTEKVEEKEERREREEISCITLLQLEAWIYFLHIVYFYKMQHQ